MTDVRISRIDPSLPLPAYETPGAVAFDLATRIDATILAGATMKLPTNIIIEVPKGHVLLLIARSSLMKRDLVLANGVGVIDEDYCGTEDEIQLAIHNVGTRRAEIQSGDRLAQGLLVPVVRAHWNEVARVDLTTTSRGGFGTTGT
jgi:dUTP pyrophosphatase